ncbi:STAS domain-containing protein, partial [Candidatus Sumerlaeota bacterium]|nr:STAS domain-containing protein [Candidatus Sumerlaeota bacterium]
MDTQRQPGNAIRSELVAHFQKMREPLLKQWMQLMTSEGLLTGIAAGETENELATIYDTRVRCLETGRYDEARAYAKALTERGALRGMTAGQIVGVCRSLCHVCGRSLFDLYHGDLARLNGALDVYEPVANRILSIVVAAFIEEKEKTVRQQQEAIRELSTPVLQLREGLLILPIIGMIDTQRARQLTEQLLRAIRANRARVAVLDITGVAAV